VIRVYLSYDRNGVSTIQGIKRISTPGLRNYVGVDSLPRVRNNLGIAIISTSQGVITDKTARAGNVGGEILCEVW
jgi:small subunit ribosomal protein S8